MQPAALLTALQEAAYGPALAGITISCVTISVIHAWEHDPVLRIAWSMPIASTETAPSGSQGVVTASYTRPSDATIVLPRELATPAELEDAIIAAAWSLGAWDLVRIELAPLAVGADWREARYGLLDSFGRNDVSVMGQRLSTGGMAAQRVLDIAADLGYIKWRFVPLGLAGPAMRRSFRNADSTLRADGTRAGGPIDARQVWAQPQTPGLNVQHCYQLGVHPSEIGGRVRPTRGGVASYERRLARRAAARTSTSKGS